MITKFDAIQSLVGGQLSGKRDGSEVNYLDGQTPPTESEIQTELDRLQAEYDGQEYARSRKDEYPDIGDQLDDLFHAGAFSTEMTATLQAVKDKYPKEVV